MVWWFNIGALILVPDTIRGQTTEFVHTERTLGLWVPDTNWR
ncbi:hypothetical protein [Bacillus sp. UNC41MFS5]|nr:hypothetical protein [Bacillus sp. UNC41MFS5]